MTIAVFETAQEEWSSESGIHNLLDLWEHSEHKQAMEQLIGQMVANRPRHESIADLGCGPGRTINSLPPFKTYRGYDTSQLFLEEAVRVHGNDGHCAFQLRDLFLGAPYRKPVDVLLCIDVSRHYHDPLGLLALVIERWPAQAYLFTVLHGPEDQDLLNGRAVATATVERRLPELGMVVEAHDIAIPGFAPLVVRYVMVESRQVDK